MPYGLVVDGELRELGDVKYLLSPQDLMAVEHLSQLIEVHTRCLHRSLLMKAAQPAFGSARGPISGWDSDVAT